MMEGVMFHQIPRRKKGLVAHQEAKAQQAAPRRMVKRDRGSILQLQVTAVIMMMTIN
jgi:hypothetical protein